MASLLCNYRKWITLLQCESNEKIHKSWELSIWHPVMMYDSNSFSNKSCLTAGWLMDLFVTAERTTATGCGVLQKGSRAERASSDQRGEQWDSEETYQSQPTALPVHGGPAGIHRSPSACHIMPS